jgi:hypothetical protein
MKLHLTLVWIANRWVDEHRRHGARVSLETLSSRASSDGKLFRRIAAGRPMMLATFENVVEYLGRGSSWPTNECPADVLEHIKDVTPSLQEAA